MINVIFHKAWICILSPLTILYLGGDFIANHFRMNSDFWMFYQIYRFIWSIMILIWSLCMISIFNLRALKVSMTSFIFWFKIFQCSSWMVSGLILVSYWNFWKVIIQHIYFILNIIFVCIQHFLCWSLCFVALIASIHQGIIKLPSV